MITSQLIQDLYFGLIGYLRLGLKGRATIRIDASSVCQLKCPVCTEQWRPRHVSGFGHLKFNDFKSLVDQNSHFRTVELSNAGEIFLNPELIKIIEYAHQKKVRLTALNGVNLNHATDEVLYSLVKYRFKALRVSLDGASDETYKIHRVGGDFNQVIQNIEKINAYKKDFQSAEPELKWQFIVFGHNQHEIPLARQMARHLQMEFILKRNSDPKYSPIEPTMTEPLLKESHSEISKAPHVDQEIPTVCSQMFTNPQINWDGAVLGCCYNQGFRGNYGNAFKSGLQTCLRGEKYQYAIGMLEGKKEPRSDIPCTECKVYIQRRTQNKYVKDYQLIEISKRVLKNLFKISRQVAP